ncbi:MAG: hypothetical protein D6722_24200, partial [Bacteroidetes bacterium]
MAFYILSLSGLWPLWGQLSVSLSGGMGASLGLPADQVSAPPDPGFFSVSGLAQRAYAGAFDRDLHTRLRLHYAWSRHLIGTLDGDFTAGGSRFARMDPQTGRQTLVDIRSPRWQISPGLMLSTGWRTFAPYFRAAWLLPVRHELCFRQLSREASGATLR